MALPHNVVLCSNSCRAFGAGRFCTPLPSCSPQARTSLYGSIHAQRHSCYNPRLQYHLYRRGHPPFYPSPYLIRRLRQYENLHSTCTRDMHQKNTSSRCQFLVLKQPFGLPGMGNKMVALVSTFLYALLTNRVMYITNEENMDRLFCEPFPSSSWMLPNSMQQVVGALNDSIRLGRGDLKGSCRRMELPGYLYVYLAWNHDRDDTYFFCGQQQAAIARQVPWLFITSNVYYAPVLQRVPSFREELERLFPDAEAVFYLLARYLLHPSDSVWEIITNFYKAHLAGAWRLVGVQVRISPPMMHMKDHYTEDVFSCLVKRNLLVGVGRASTATVVAALNHTHFDRLKELYYLLYGGNHVISFYHPSNEGRQQTGNFSHDQRALMDIYLLSFCNVLITTPMSTFGQVAQGLSGLRPWVMWSKRSSRHQVCSRARSVEPPEEPTWSLHCPSSLNTAVCNVIQRLMP